MTDVQLVALCESLLAGGGKKQWRDGGPTIARALVRMIGGDSRIHQLAGEARLMAEQIADLNKQVADLKFDRDRAVLANNTAVALVGKLISEHVDPSYLDADVIRRAREVTTISEST